MERTPVSDELAIRNLVARYADAVARRDEAAWSATWTDDGEWHVMGQSNKGREAVVKTWNQLMGGLEFVIQLASTGLVELDGDRATGRWYITEHGRFPGGAALLNLGVYHDEYRYTEQGWRFARRRFDPLYMGPPDLSAEPRPFPTDI
jgi:ketosteroid isomerase-like protein